MERRIVRIMAGCLAVFMCIPAAFLTGCHKKSGGKASDLPSEITADMPWYESKVTYVTNDIDPYVHELTEKNILGVASDIIVARTNAYKIMSFLDSSDARTDDLLQFYDLNGEHLMDVDLIALIREYAPASTGMQIIDEYISDGLVVAQTQIYESSHIRNELLYIDPANGSLARTEPFEFAQDFRMLQWSREIDGSTVNTYTAPNVDGGLPYYYIEIIDSSGTSTVLDLQEQLPFITVTDIGGFLYLGDGKMLLKIFRVTGQQTVCLVDINAKTASDISNDDSYEWINDMDIIDYSYYDGIGNLSVDYEGIKKLNLEDKTEEVYISFDYCDLNRFDAENMMILDAGDDRVVLGGNSFREEIVMGVGMPATVIAVLQRADTNPNAGKKVISAASVGRLSYAVCESIRQFNEESRGTFIMIDQRYDYEMAEQNVVFEEGMDYDTYDLAVTAAIMNELSLDLLAGEGPDIILGAMDYRHLDNPDMLLDLSSEVTSPSLYGNVMEYAEVDGVLYQVPVAFAMEGMLVRSDSVPQDAAGFTFDSYNDYIRDCCHGGNPNYMTKLEFMCMCVSQMGSAFTEGNGYNFSGDTFVRVAEFADSQFLPDELSVMSIDNPVSREFTEIHSVLEYIEQTNGRLEDYRLMGFPSESGSGPLIVVSDSVAVSAATSYEEDCRAFVRLLLSDDVQTMFANSYGIPVNREAQHAVCEPFADRNNRWYQALMTLYQPAQLEQYGYAQAMIDPDLLQQQIDGYIESAAGIRMMDAPVEIIVREEIQAYFAGQKTIEQTMELIQNRVDTFVNERG